MTAEIEPVEPDFFPTSKPQTPEYATTFGHNWKRDQEAAKLAATGHTTAQIAEMLHLLNGEGLPDPARAGAAVRRAFGAHYRFTADEMRWQQLQSIDELKRQLWDELNEDHVLVQQGRIIVLDGVPVEDKRLALEIRDRILKCEERIAKLMGLDATTRISVEADQIGSEINAMIAMINAADAPSTPALPPAPAPGDNDA